jgi:hypothetical protein
MTQKEIKELGFKKLSNGTFSKLYRSKFPPRYLKVKPSEPQTKPREDAKIWHVSIDDTPICLCETVEQLKQVVHVFTNFERRDFAG